MNLKVLTAMMAVWPVFAIAQPVAPQQPPPPASAPAPPPAAVAPAAPDGSAPAAPSAAQSGQLAAGTAVWIQLVDPVSSNGGRTGDHFAIRLAAPLTVDGKVVVPAGVTGQGEIVYAEAGGGGGAPGKLVLAARYLDAPGGRIRLKAFHLADGGDSHFREMQVAAEIAGPLVMLVNGADVVYPAGTIAKAKIAEAYPALPTPAADTGASTSSIVASPASPAPASASPASH